MSTLPKQKTFKTVAVIIAHPDDETLWAGGTILENPSWQCHIISLSRANDPDRAPKFYKVLDFLAARGGMGDMDDGPEQNPQDMMKVNEWILKLLPAVSYDLIITHDPAGEYTRHLRHEEIARSVIELWNDHRILTQELWTFAYEDGGKKYFPRPIKNAYFYYDLPLQTWENKYKIITDIYGFRPDSFEAQTTPRAEAFWCFSSPGQAWRWLKKGG